MSSDDVDKSRTARVSSIRSYLQGIRDSFSSLNGSPSSLWLIYLVKFLESFAYFSTSVIFTIFLSEDFGYSDSEAGFFYGIMGSVTTVYGFAVGLMIDRLGVRTSLILGSTLCMIGRLLVGITTSPTVLYGMAFFVLPLGNSLSIPVMTLAVKGCTGTNNRGFAFGLFYSIMNVGALLSGFLVDGLTLSLGGQPVMGLSPNRWIFVSVGLSTSIILFVAVFFIKDTRKMDTDSVAAATGTMRVGVLHSVKDLLAQKSFWRFVAFTLITVNLKSIFRHLDATFPKYLVREFGPNVAKGTIYSINPFMIIFLVPCISAVTSKYENFDQIHLGAYVSALSVLFVVASTSITSSILFVVVLSLGEALWSPRFYDYTVSVAPEGKEGTFMALASAPLFFATLPVGMLSGFLLEWYCPEEGPRDSRMMWLIIALLTGSSPVLITLTQRWIREPSVIRDKGHVHVSEEFLEADTTAMVVRCDGKGSLDDEREETVENEKAHMLAVPPV